MNCVATAVAGLQDAPIETIQSVDPRFPINREMNRLLHYICIFIVGASISGCAIRTPRTLLAGDLTKRDTLSQITSVLRIDNTELHFANRSGVYSGQRKEISGTSEHGLPVLLPLSSIVSCDVSPASGLLTMGAYFFGIVGVGLLLVLLLAHSTPVVY